MVSVENISVEFSSRPLFSKASFVINPKDRIALMGKNGAGKSTLLKIIAGQQQPTSGVVARQNDITIGYLPQVMVLSDERTVMEEAQTAFSRISALQAEMEDLNRQLSTREDYESESYLRMVERFSHLQDRLSMMGGTNCQAELERTLRGLGFRPSDFHRPTSEFSGGWRMRIELAKLLLQQPDVLLLDEPTNHLDIGSIQWLEQFLVSRANAVVLVSHDRRFINNVTSRTLEISCGRLTDYKVKYDEYVKLRAERREQQLRAYENQQKEIAEIKDFIERFRYKPTKSNQVQSRIKQLEKIVPIEVDEVDRSSLHLKFPPCLRSGDYPVICKEVSKTYGAHHVFSHVDLTIKRGEKVAFVGNNGEGKSTLVKCIMGEIAFDGELKLGHQVQIGYFAQNQAQLLDGQLTVFDTIDRVARGDVRTRIRDILGAFMFGGEESDKFVKVLSGGERTRLAMIRLLLEPVNFLILDEPTNHLDMRSKDVLKEALVDFDGTAVIVSHDRDFLDGLVDKVYVFAEGKVREFIGSVDDYLQASAEQTRNMGGTLSSSSSSSLPVAAVEKNPRGKLSYQEQKERAKARKKMEKERKACEEQITRIEGEMAALEARLSTPEGASDSSLFSRHAELSRELDAMMEHWMDLEE